MPITDYRIILTKEQPAATARLVAKNSSARGLADASLVGKRARPAGHRRRDLSDRRFDDRRRMNAATVRRPCAPLDHAYWGHVRGVAALREEGAFRPRRPRG